MGSAKASKTTEFVVLVVLTKADERQIMSQINCARTQMRMS
jgi:hypothetical protein